MPEIWTIHVWWWAGAHGSHIRSIGLIPSDSITIWEWDSPPETLQGWVVCIPIDRTRGVVAGIFEYWYNGQPNPPQVATMCGVMGRTVPEYLKYKVSSFHLLWWPQTPTNELKIVRATDGIHDSLSRTIVKNAQDKWIKILELSRNDHDREMAFHQALTHVAIILHDSTAWVVKIKPGTSSQVIAQMITLNPLFKDVWEGFTGFIQEGKSLGDAYLRCMKEANPSIGTTNSANQIKNALHWKSLSVNPDNISYIDSALQNNNASAIMALIDYSRRT